MDWVTTKDSAIAAIKKYRYVLIVLLIGVLLMQLPESTNTESVSYKEPAEARPELQHSLSEILSMVSGAGRVEVLLTQAEGELTLYQTDDDISSEDIRKETVMITTSDREETGLIKQINPPIYQGAVVLCQGADNANVRLSIVEAVMSATGLTSDRITVLKMK